MDSAVILSAQGELEAKIIEPPIKMCLPRYPELQTCALPKPNG